jgi:hypothetical protein
VIQVCYTLRLELPPEYLWNCCKVGFLADFCQTSRNWISRTVFP